MTEKRFTLKYINEQHISANLYDNETFIGAIGIGEELIVELLNGLSEENELLKEEKELLKNKLDRIEDILPHFLSCAEISEFHSKIFKEDIALMKCWNKRYQK